MDEGVAELRSEDRLSKLYSVLVLTSQIELFMPRISNAENSSIMLFLVQDLIVFKKPKAVYLNKFISNC